MSVLDVSLCLPGHNIHMQQANLASNHARSSPKPSVSLPASRLCAAMHTFESLHMLSHGHYWSPVLASCCEDVYTYAVTKAWIAASGAAAMCKTEQCCPACLHQHADHGRLIMTNMCCLQAKWQVSKHIRSRYFNNLDATEAYIKGISHLHDTYLIRVGHPLCAESKQPPCGLYS